MTPDFLMDVFNLESIPKFLKSEKTELTVKINPSNLDPNDFYTVRGPGLDVAKRKIKDRNRNYGKSVFFRLAINQVLLMIIYYIYQERNKNKNAILNVFL